MLEECHLVRLATLGWLHIEIIELVGRAAGRRINETATINRNIRSRTIQRLLRENRSGLQDSIFDSWYTQDIARP